MMIIKLIKKVNALDLGNLILVFSSQIGGQTSFRYLVSGSNETQTKLKQSLR